jgi:hypothetical protein
MGISLDFSWDFHFDFQALRLSAKGKLAPFRSNLGRLQLKAAQFNIGAVWASMRFGREMNFSPEQRLSASPNDVR